MEYKGTNPFPITFLLTEREKAFLDSGALGTSSRAEGLRVLVAAYIRVTGGAVPRDLWGTPAGAYWRKREIEKTSPVSGYFGEEALDFLDDNCNRDRKRMVVVIFAPFEQYFGCEHPEINEATAQVLLEAAVADRLRKKNARPQTARRQGHCVTLSRVETETLARIGGGNVSRGVRTLIERYATEKEKAPAASQGPEKWE